MISKLIKLTAFRLTFAVLNQSVTLTLCRGSGKEESKIFNVKLNFPRVYNSYNHFQAESTCMIWKTWL